MSFEKYILKSCIIVTHGILQFFLSPPPSLLSHPHDAFLKWRQHFMHFMKSIESSFLTNFNVCQSLLFRVKKSWLKIAVRRELECEEEKYIIKCMTKNYNPFKAIELRAIWIMSEWECVCVYMWKREKWKRLKQRGKINLI